MVRGRLDGWMPAASWKKKRKKAAKKKKKWKAIGKRVEEAHKLRQHSHLHIRIEVETVAVSGGGDQNK